MHLKLKKINIPKIKKPGLIPNWKKCWRMFSQQAFVAAGALQTTWLILDSKQISLIPDTWASGITIAIVVLGFIGRLIPQKKAQ